jgi:hypothetical protein
LSKEDLDVSTEQGYVQLFSAIPVLSLKRKGPWIKLSGKKSSSFIMSIIGGGVHGKFWMNKNLARLMYL